MTSEVSVLDKHLDTAVGVRIDVVNIAIRHDCKILLEGVAGGMIQLTLSITWRWHAYGSREIMKTARDLVIV